MCARYGQFYIFNVTMSVISTSQKVLFKLLNWLFCAATFACVACDSNSTISFSDESVYDAEKNTLTDLRDGQVYRTTTIAPEGTGYSKVWMAQNLNYRYNLKSVNGGVADTSSYCVYNAPEKCKTLGRLYTWPAAMDSAALFSTDGKGCGYTRDCKASEVVRGVCPKGWHLPSMEEFEALLNAVGGSSVAALKLKATHGWTEKGNGADAFGFAALPAGFRDADGHFGFQDSSAYFWSTTEVYFANSYFMDMYFRNNSADIPGDNKDIAFSVRCVKN